MGKRQDAVGFKTFDPSVSARNLSGAIIRDGCAVVNGIIGVKALDQLQEEIAPHLAAIEVGDPDPFMGHKTKRFGALLSRCVSSRSLVMTPLILESADHILRPYCARYRINYTGVMHIEPGETAQTIHRDTGMYPIQNPSPPLTLSTMWAVTDFTERNGATRVIPGSHKWPDSRRPKPHEIKHAEMSAGSVLLYLGNMLHGGGANNSSIARCGLNLVYALGWLRQEENQYLAVPFSEVRNFPPELQKLIGYDLGTVNLGFVDHKHPFELLNGTAGKKAGVLGEANLMADDNSVQRFKISGTEVTRRARFEV